MCEIPLPQLDTLADDLPDLRKQLMRTMGTEIRHDQNMMLLLSKKNAEERVASFLLDISQRYARRGFSANHFRLPMSRVDISNYLGLAVETISRVFTRFQKNGLIETQGKEVILQDLEMLREMAGLNPDADCKAHTAE